MRAFVAATLEGLDWAVAHPDEAVALYVQRHPELKRGPAAGAVEGRRAVDGRERRAGGRLAGRRRVAALNDWMVQTGQLEEPVDVGPRGQQRLPAGRVSAAA